MCDAVKNSMRATLVVLLASALKDVLSQRDLPMDSRPTGIVHHTTRTL